MVTSAMKLKDACSLEDTANLGSILKSRDITLSTNINLVKATVFPVVVYGCENWTIKKAECWIIDAFEYCGVSKDSLASFGLQGDQSSES